MVEEGNALARAVERTRRGHEEVARRLLTDGLEQVESADDVRLDVCARIFQAVAYAGLGGEMDHYLRFCGGERGLLLQHRDMQTEIVAAFEQRTAFGLQALVIERSEPVEAVDDMAVIEEPAAEVKADEAGRPGDENPHWPVPEPTTERRRGLLNRGFGRNPLRSSRRAVDLVRRRCDARGRAGPRGFPRSSWH